MTVLAATRRAPSITAFRGELRAILEREMTDGRRDVVVLAVDGVGHDLAAAAWRGARTTRMRSVFPTTSSTGWLSSLTGADVDAHGVPGVVFKADGEIVDVFSYTGALGPDLGNVFGDANALGYAPLSILGDLEDYPCSWRAALVRHSRDVGDGQRFYAAEPARDAAAIAGELRAAIDRCLAGRSRAERPTLLWCFVDLDRHIHRHGYDDHVIELLEHVDRLATDLAAQGALVVAHSDHGLTPTTHDPELARLLDRAAGRHQVGGAGRVRWIYAPPAAEEELIAALERDLPATVRLCASDDIFRPGSLAHQRTGAVVLIAEGDDFVTSPGYRFDHGSLTAAELDVPFARWEA